MKFPQIVLSIALFCIFAGCDDEDNDNSGTAADQAGVGAECVVDTDCPQPESDTDTAPAQVCLQQFKGGYCGIENCTANEECPDGSVCVAHDDGVNYCFRQCIDKVECNVNRTADNESNCSANIEFVDPTTPGKACVPPSN